MNALPCSRKQFETIWASGVVRYPAGSSHQKVIKGQTWEVTVLMYRLWPLDDAQFVLSGPRKHTITGQYKPALLIHGRMHPMLCCLWQVLIIWCKCLSWNQDSSNQGLPWCLLIVQFCPWFPVLCRQKCHICTLLAAGIVIIINAGLTHLFTAVGGSCTNISWS